MHFRKSADAGGPAVTWTLAYDERNRLTGRSAAIAPGDEPFAFFGTTAQAFAYDDLGRMIRAVDSSPEAFPGAADVAVELFHDSAGRPYREDQIAPLNSTGFSRTVSREYNAEGFRTSLLHPEAFDLGAASLGRYRVSYEPDSLGRLRFIRGRKSMR